VTRRTDPKPGPPGGAKPSTVTRRSAHTTVRPPAPFSRRPPRPVRATIPKPSLRPPHPAPHPKRQVARILDDDATVLDLLDNLLSKGVVLNADVILALANVDLVYIRLSALLCAADRVLPGASLARGHRGPSRGAP
jgi:hypothetical protein